MNFLWLAQKGLILGCYSMVHRWIPSDWLRKGWLWGVIQWSTVEFPLTGSERVDCGVLFNGPPINSLWLAQKGLILGCYSMVHQWIPSDWLRKGWLWGVIQWYTGEFPLTGSERVDFGVLFNGPPMNSLWLVQKGLILGCFRWTSCPKIYRRHSCLLYLTQRGLGW